MGQWTHNVTPEVEAKSNWLQIVVVCIVLSLLMTAVVALRGYVRAVMLRTVGWADWVIYFSCVSCELQASVVTLMLKLHSC